MKTIGATLFATLITMFAGSAGAHDGTSYDHHYDSECKDADGFYRMSLCHRGKVRLIDHTHGDYSCHETERSMHSFHGSEIAIDDILKSVEELPPGFKNLLESKRDEYRSMTEHLGALHSHVCW